MSGVRTVPYQPTAEDNAVGIVPLSPAEETALATGGYQPGVSLDQGTGGQPHRDVLPPETKTEIPEKFRTKDGGLNQEALLKSYQELEKKLGQPKDDPAKEPDPNAVDPNATPQDQPKDGQEDPDTEAAKAAEKAAKDAVGEDKFAEFSEKIAQKGNLDEEDYEKLAKEHGIPRQMAETYVKGFQAQMAQARTQLFEQAGLKGEEEWTQIAQWAVANLNQAEKDAFDRAVAADNGAGAAWALQGLKARFVQANGQAPNLVKGVRSGSPSGAGYESREAYLAELDKATRTNDPGLHAQIQRKLSAMPAATRRAWLGGIDPNTTRR